jgi:hypothetical protein
MYVSHVLIDGTTIEIWRQTAALPSAVAAPAETRAFDEAQLNEALDESFPASDPISSLRFD